MLESAPSEKTWPRILFIRQRSYETLDGWHVGFAWSLMPVEDRKPGFHIYRRRAWITVRPMMFREALSLLSRFVRIQWR